MVGDSGVFVSETESEGCCWHDAAASCPCRTSNLPS